MSLRLRDCLPTPHEAEHSPQAPHHVSTQSTAHGLVLHLRVSYVFGHAMPLCSGRVTTGRVCACVPPPHDLVHWVHWVDHSPTTQSTGHGPRLHASWPMPDGHGLPP